MPRARESSAERRDHVIQAAMREFAEHGYAAANTTAIARRVGISQPYVYALFSTKRELFFAAHDHALATVRAALLAAVRGATGRRDTLRRMEAVYAALPSDGQALLCEFQACAAAVGDPEIRPRVVSAFEDLVDEVADLSGLSPQEVTGSISAGIASIIGASFGARRPIDQTDS